MRDNQDRIGRYQVTSELGRGSMGVVHLAHDPVMGRDVAIKTVLLPHGLSDDEKDAYQERFHYEAQAAGRLSHPAIVTIYEFDQEQGPDRPFIAMEFVEGPTLHELICSEGALKPEWALGMADSLADGLQSAHDAGIIHRDLKPANILVRESDGVSKIADFGVARVTMSDQPDTESTCGSPAYMAPERLSGQKADERSDLFALAVIFYEALSGARPFEGPDFAAVCHSILNDDPISIRERTPDLCLEFDTFFRVALAKNPDDRFQSGTEFREALETVWREQERLGSAADEAVVLTSDHGSQDDGAYVGPSYADEPVRVNEEPEPDPFASYPDFDIPSEDSTESQDAREDHEVTDARETRDSQDADAPQDTVGDVLAELDGDLPSTEEGPPFLATALPELAESEITYEATEVGDANIEPGIPNKMTIAISVAALLLLIAFGAGWFMRGSDEGAEAAGADPTTLSQGPGAVPTISSVAGPEHATDSELTEKFRQALDTPEPAAVEPPAPESVKAPVKKGPTAEEIAAAKAAEAAAEAEAAAGAQDLAEAVVAAELAEEQIPYEDIAEETPPVPAGPVLVTIPVTIKSNVKAGQLMLVVDGTEVFKTDLEGESKGLPRMFKKAKGQGSQEIETTLELEPGAHTIAVKLAGGAGTKSRDDRLDIEVAEGDSRTLRIVAGKTFGRRLTIKFE
jgi:serine/threonine protein kinase